MRKSSELWIDVRPLADSWVAELSAPGLGGPCVVARAVLESEGAARHWADVTVRALDETGASGVLAAAAAVVSPAAIAAAEAGGQVLIYDKQRGAPAAPQAEADTDIDVEISEEEILDATVVEADAPFGDGSFGAPPAASGSELDFLSFDDAPARPAAAAPPVIPVPEPILPPAPPPPRANPPRADAFVFADLAAPEPAPAPTAPPKPPPVVKRDVAAMAVSVVRPSPAHDQHQVAATEVEPPAPPRSLRPELAFESLVRPQSRFDTAPVAGNPADVGGQASGGGATMTAGSMDPAQIAALMAAAEAPEPAAPATPARPAPKPEPAAAPEPSAADVAAQLKAMAARLVANRDQTPSAPSVMPPAVPGNPKK